MTKEGSSKIVNFITLGARIPVLGRDHINHIVQMHTYKLTNCINKLRNASTRVNNYMFITTLDKR
mgnify:CR=1 FL=1